MEITQKRRARLQAAAAQFLLGIAGLALITFVCFRLGFHLARTAFAYVILVALVSLLGSFSASVVLSIVAAACLSYFFAMPLFDLRVDSLCDADACHFLTSAGESRNIARPKCHLAISKENAHTENNYTAAKEEDAEEFEDQSREI